MRRIVVAVMGTVSGLVLLFSYHTSTNGPASAAPSTTTSAGVTPGAASGSGSAASSATSSAAASAATATYTGEAVDTRWGPVQVAITVTDGTITAVTAVEYPQNNGRDQQINAYALPILAQEAVAAQSAKIDAVSGATVTSDGYLSSLQSAIDQAHL